MLPDSETFSCAFLGFRGGLICLLLLLALAITILTACTSNDEGIQPYTSANDEVYQQYELSYQDEHPAEDPDYGDTPAYEAPSEDDNAQQSNDNSIEEDNTVTEPREPGWDLTLPSLADAFAPYFMFGNIYSTTTRMDIGDTRAAFLHHFNAVTAENWHKPDHVAPSGFTRPAAEDYNFDRADAIVAWAIENDLTLIGHTLVWHSQSPAWLTQTWPNVFVTREEARANMEFHIRTVSEHFTAMGTIDYFHSWDVLNEAIASSGGNWSGNINDWNSGNWRSQMREDSPWFQAYANGYDASVGEHPSDFVYDAFVFARRYFPNSILYYNDYNEEIPAKRNAIGQMVEQINQQWAHDFDNNPEAVPVGEEYTGRLLIEGIGMQSHYHLDQWRTNLNNVRTALERFVATGAIISITELDITIGGQGGNHPDTLPSPLDRESQLRQAEAIERLFGYYLEFAEHIERVTVWGKADPHSWRAWGHPLLFDENYHAKEAFYAVLRSLDGR